MSLDDGHASHTSHENGEKGPVSQSRERTGARSNLLSPEQLEAVRTLSTSAKAPREGRFHRFRRLHGRARLDYFRQEFLWPLVGILIVVVLAASITTSVVSSRNRRTGLQVVSFTSVLSVGQANMVQKALRRARLTRDPVRVDSSYEYEGEGAMKLRVDASTGSVDVALATPSVMRHLAAYGYLTDVTRYCPRNAAGRAVLYPGMHYARGGHETLNKPGRGARRAYALPLSESRRKALTTLRARGGAALRVGVFTNPPHAGAVRNLLRWAYEG